MILQPQSDIPHFRRFVRKIGWQITEEEMVLEDGKFYPMMKVIHGEKMHISEDTPYTLDEWFGGMLLERSILFCGSIWKESFASAMRFLTD